MSTISGNDTFTNLPFQLHPPKEAIYTSLRHCHNCAASEPAPTSCPGALEKSQMKKVGLLLLAVLTIAAFGSMDSYAQYVATHHVRDVVRNGRAAVVGAMPAGQLMTLNVVLPLSNQAALDEFLTELYDPN